LDPLNAGHTCALPDDLGIVGPLAALF